MPTDYKTGYVYPEAKIGDTVTMEMPPPFIMPNGDQHNPDYYCHTNADGMKYEVTSKSPVSFSVPNGNNLEIQIKAIRALREYLIKEFNLPQDIGALAKDIIPDGEKFIINGIFRRIDGMIQMLEGLVK